VLKGADLGSVFIVKKEKVTIGRGDGVDLLIQDEKSSRVHATLELSQKDLWKIQDMGSVNGIVLNGKMIRQGDLKSGDMFQIGDTLFEFLTEKASLKELITPVKPRLVQENFEKKIKLESQSKKGGHRKNKTTVLIAAFFCLIFLFSMLNDQKNKIEEQKTQIVGMGMPNTNAPQTYIAGERQQHHYAADRIFNQGFREFVEKNYLRAYYFFTQALNTDPTHQKAKIYQKRASDAIQEEVQARLARARLNQEIGRTQDALDHYEAILRLLHYNKSDKNYALAQEKIKEIVSGGSR